MTPDPVRVSSPSNSAPPGVGVGVQLVDEDGTTRLTLSGCVSDTTVSGAWSDTVPPVRERRPGHLVLDGSKLIFCDGTGLALIVELERVVRMGGGRTTFEGFPPDLRRLIDHAILPPEVKARAAPGRVEALGAAAAERIEESRALTSFLGETVLALGWALRHPRKVRGREALLVGERAGPDAVPVVCLLGWLIGLIFAFEGVAPFSRYGAVSRIPTFIAIALARELGPLITAIIVAGRTAAAFAAELGTMKVTEEIDALRTLGLDPVRLLVVPRVLAAMIVTPLLGLVCTGAGLVGGYAVMASLGYGWHFYIEQVKWAVTAASFTLGFSKGFAFGFVVGTTGCAHGLRTRAGPGAVGASTTTAVVASIVLVIIVDGIFAYVWYACGK
jgi:phospholipid/cholesterol/gamma-HCH transport system permease protein